MHQVTLLLFLFIFSLNSYSDVSKITWARAHYPPYFIAQGKDIDQGIHDIIRKELEKELTEYQHSLITLENPRLFHFLTTKKKTYSKFFCVPGSPAPVHPNIIIGDLLFKLNGEGVALESNFAKKFEQGKSYSLVDIILHSKDLPIAFPDSKNNLSPDLVSTFEKYPDKFYKIPSVHPSKLFKMTAAKRIQGGIVFPFTYSYYLKNNPQQKGKLSFINLKETSLNTSIYIMCRKQKGIEKLLKRISEIVKTPRMQKIFKDQLKKYDTSIK